MYPVLQMDDFCGWGGIVINWVVGTPPLEGHICPLHVGSHVERVGMNVMSKRAIVIAA